MIFFNNFLQVWLIDNQRYQFPPFIYINRADEVYHLFRGSKLLGDIKYLTKPVKLEAEAVRICTE